MAEAGPERVTFEQGYEELKTIVGDLDRPDISVHEMFEGFRRGKGLEKALRGYLEQREGELTEIAEGNNVPEFEIVAPSAPASAHGATATAERDIQATRGRSTPTEEEIPF